VGGSDTDLGLIRAQVALFAADEGPRVNTPLPLAGIRVLEFSHTVMGPSCGVILADLGADVVKIEPPEGEPTRRSAGFASGFFPFFNRNKRGMTTDLKSAAGSAEVRALLRDADVLIENYAPGTMERLGLDYDTLAAENPRLIYCSLKGFLTGPYEHRPALDEIVQYMTGLAYMTGPPGRPLRAGASVVDILGGAFGAIGILAAIEERHRTGRGQFVKSSLFESAAFFVGQHMAGEAVVGEAPLPMPARGAAWGIYEVFPTADGAGVFIGVTSDKHWERFCAALGFTELYADATLRDNGGRVAAKERIKQSITPRIAEFTVPEISAILEEASIPYSPVATPSDLFDDPQLNAGRGMMHTRLADGRFTKLPGLPLEMGAHVLGLRRQPPALGEHNDELRAACHAEPVEARQARPSTSSG
jgi:crotonobetainyl-CoA:carnitine CoA-transferase CaiB-like acyl-CoA transferase